MKVTVTSLTSVDLRVSYRFMDSAFIDGADIANKSLYIYSILETPNNDDKKSKKNFIMGLIPIPSILPRYIMFPGTNEFILLEDLILAFTESVFSNYKVIYKTVTAVTRNSDINLQQTPIDEDEDYRHYMKKILKKRNIHYSWSWSCCFRFRYSRWRSFCKILKYLLTKRQKNQPNDWCCRYFCIPNVFSCCS